jgi:hypothetical protein
MEITQMDNFGMGIMDFNIKKMVEVVLEEILLSD